MNHLCDERSVLLTHFIVEVISPVVSVPNKHLSVQHGGVAQLGVVAAAEQAVGQLTLLHHGAPHAGRAPDGTPEEGGRRGHLTNL